MIFHSYVSLPEGIPLAKSLSECFSRRMLSQGLGHAECLRLVGDEGKPLDENPTDPAGS